VKRLLLAAALACTACASTAPLPTPTAAALEQTTVDVAKAADSVRGSTRSEVAAALGPAAVVRFASGYEVWAYRFVPRTSRKPEKGRDQEAAPSELVLLFAPSGVVTKARVRAPASATRASP
jgi:hypothetical protein